MVNISKVIEYYGKEQYNKFLKDSEKNKFNGFDLKVSNKKDLMVIIGDLRDTYKLSLEQHDGLIERIEELQAEVEELKANPPTNESEKVQTNDSSIQSVQYNNGIEGLNDKNGLYKTTDWN